MVDFYPVTDANAHGMLDVGDSHRVYWETRGNPAGTPVVVLHGGPGSGAGPGWARFFDPAVYRVVLFDQRGCGQSTPHASDPGTDLSTNTTAHLVADIERLREHLGIHRWMVFGGSWGSTLGLAYIEEHPSRAIAAVLFSVTTTTRREVEWVTQDMRRVFPAQWEKFAAGVPGRLRGQRLVDAYAELLFDPDPAICDRAARDWCDWEDTTSQSARTINLTRDTTTRASGWRSLASSHTTGGTRHGSRKVSCSRGPVPSATSRRRSLPGGWT